MLCPYCHTEYTMESPCFCQPPIATKDAESDNAPDSQKVSEDQAIGWNTCRGNRID